MNQVSIGNFIEYGEQMFDAMDVGVFITDGTGKILTINSIFDNVTTIQRDELIGQEVKYMLGKGYISESNCHRVVSEKRAVTENAILSMSIAAQSRKPCSSRSFSAIFPVLSLAPIKPENLACLKLLMGERFSWMRLRNCHC